MSKTGIEGVEEARKARKVAEAIIRGFEVGKIESGFTARELGKRHLAGVPADVIPAAISILVDDGSLETRTFKTSGRKRVEYHRTVASRPAAPTPAQLANAEQDRLDALEEAENASEDRDGYRRELARVRGQVRELETALRTERHEHAETRAKLAHAAASAAARLADDAGLALATAEARLRHQAADYERRIADLTRQAALSEQRAREAREQADRVLVGAMLGAHQAARVLAEHGVRGES